MWHFFFYRQVQDWNISLHLSVFFALECVALSSCCSLCSVFHSWMSDRCKLAMKILPLAAPSLLKKDSTNHCCYQKTPRLWKPLSPSEVFKDLLYLSFWSQVYSRISEDAILGRAFWKQAKRELKGGRCEKSWWQGCEFHAVIKVWQSTMGIVMPSVLSVSIWLHPLGISDSLIFQWTWRQHQIAAQ